MKRHHLPESFGPPAGVRPGSGRPTVDVVPVLSVRPPPLRDPPARDVYLENLRESYRARRAVRLRERHRAILFIVGIIILLALACIADRVFAGEKAATVRRVDEKSISFEWADTREIYAQKVTRHILSRYATCNPKKYQGKLCNRALDLVSVLLDTCRDENVNPLLIAAIISLESNWDVSCMESNTGAYGLMQVNTGWKNAAVVEEYTLDPAEQLKDGITILKISLAKCGTVRGALAFYATGKTCIPIPTSDLRYKMAIKIDGGSK